MRQLPLRTYSPAEIEDHRFYAEHACEGTFEVKDPDGTPKLRVCGRRWCNRNEKGETICQYCGALRPDALPEGTSRQLEEGEK